LKFWYSKRLALSSHGTKYQNIMLRIQEVMIFLLGDGKARQRTIFSKILFFQTFPKTTPTISFKLSEWYRNDVCHVRWMRRTDARWQFVTCTPSLTWSFLYPLALDIKISPSTWKAKRFQQCKLPCYVEYSKGITAYLWYYVLFFVEKDKWLKKLR